MDKKVQPAAGRRPRGRPRKTREELDDGNRRRDLLNSAAKRFRKRGFDATSTRDIAAAAGMQSGSPFYHFESKSALLFAVMEEGMRTAIARQQRALESAGDRLPAAQRLRVHVRNHFDVLLGPGSEFIPVMLHAAGRLKAEVKLARLLIFGALNWSAQWYDRRKCASRGELADAALALFIR